MKNQPISPGVVSQTLEHIDAGAALLDDDGRILYCNSALSEIANETPQSLIGRRLGDLCTPGTLLERPAEGGVQSEPVVFPATGGRRRLTLEPLAGEAAGGGALALFREPEDRPPGGDDPRRRYRDLFENAVHGIFLLNRQGRILEANPAMATLLGYDSPQELLGAVSDFGDQVLSDPEQHRMLFELLETQPVVRSHETQVHTRDGDVMWASFALRGEKDETGRVVRAQGMAEDITEQKRAQWMLVEAEERYRSVFEGAREGFFQCTPYGRFVQGNPSLAKLFGYEDYKSLSAAVGNVGSDLFVHPERFEELAHRMNALGQVQDFEFRARKSDGSVVWASLAANIIRDVNGQPLLFEGVVRDVSARKAAESSLLYQASHDSLTGLVNRAMFLSHLDKALQQAKRHEQFSFGLMYMDLDRFKVINDSLGHTAGDALLVRLGRRLKDCLRSEDVIARLGGDEFAVLLNNLGDTTDAYRVAERMQAALEKSFTIEGSEVFVFMSIGIVLHTERYTRPEQMLRDADMAMYRAKAEPTMAYAQFDETMHKRALDRLALETDLRRALERAEFQLYYQPIVHLATGAIHGFEALLRWERPGVGMIPPMQCIPVLEETGLIEQVGAWVLDTACDQAVRWRSQMDAAAPFMMHVNISPRQMFTGDLVRHVVDALDRSGLAPAELKLEITESVVMDQAHKVEDMLGELKKLGVKLGIDDFGTGYSSLAYLHRFPLDMIKVDKSFVADLGREGSRAEIVRAIVSMAHGLGKSVVAEGVETAEQLSVIMELGCAYAQGYYFSRPLAPAGAFELMQKGVA